MKKIFYFFLIGSILALLVLLGYYYLKSEGIIGDKIVAEGVPNEPNGLEGDKTDVDSNGDSAEDNGEDSGQENDGQTEEEPSYRPDVLSVHLCDRYSDGTFAIRNIKLGMTFRQVVNFELKNVGVYVDNSDYDKSTFEMMSSNEEEGKDMLPVRERALLGNACDILYNFTTDISIEEPAEYPYLESVQFLFTDSKKAADSEKKIEDAFSDCFGKPVVETEGSYSMSTFTGTKERIRMFYEYDEEKKDYNLNYILWETLE